MNYILSEKGDNMPLSTREIFAKLIACEAGGEGEDGMRAVATSVMNRVNIPYGEFARVSQGGNLRNIMFQPGQYTCMKESLGGQYNPQNIYNMDPNQQHFEIADWAINGHRLNGVDNSIYYFNPFKPICVTTFPPSGTGRLHTRIQKHCFYVPTEEYRNT